MPYCAGAIMKPNVLRRKSARLSSQGNAADIPHILQFQGGVVGRFGFSRETEVELGGGVAAGQRRERRGQEVGFGGRQDVVGLGGGNVGQDGRGRSVRVVGLQVEGLGQKTGVEILYQRGGMGGGAAGVRV